MKILTLNGLISFMVLLLLTWVTACKKELFIECESFEDKGGWVVDPQFVEQVGSPYLMAHGMGKPVENASTTVEFPSAGTYHVWARTTDWAPGHWDPPGRFNGWRKAGKNHGAF